MTVQCELCPKYCRISPGESGECRVRGNLDGKLTALTYGYPSAVHVDPIEKKPMNHFLPGSGSFSIATVGCNLHCLNCQNWEISQADPEQAQVYRLPPDQLAGEAQRAGCRSVAYTYTDPNVYYEYTLDGCIRVHEAGLKNVLVTAGYINEQPMRELYRHVDGANIDLKSIRDAFYRDICAATLEPVLRTLVAAKALGVIVEVTNLVIPTLNDSDDDLRALCAWVVANLGRETPLHFSRFHPQYRLRHLPPTPGETLARARQIARAEGLQFVYVGNILMEGGSDTSCPACGRLLVKRVGYHVQPVGLRGGRCAACGAEVYGLWE